MSYVQRVLQPGEQVRQNLVFVTANRRKSTWVQFSKL